MGFISHGQGLSTRQRCLTRNNVSASVGHRQDLSTCIRYERLRLVIKKMSFHYFTQHYQRSMDNVPLLRFEDIGFVQ